MDDLFEEVTDEKLDFDDEKLELEKEEVKEIIDYLNGDISLEEAIYIIKRDTRHFAKRQLTWFRREDDVQWVHKSEFANEEEILQYMLERI